MNIDPGSSGTPGTTSTKDGQPDRSLLASIPARTIVVQNQQNHYRENMLHHGRRNLRATEEMRVCLLSVNTDQQRTRAYVPT